MKKTAEQRLMIQVSKKDAMLRKAKFIAKDLAIIAIMGQGLFLIAATYRLNIHWFGGLNIRTWNELITAMFIWTLAIMAIMVLQKTILSQKKWLTPALIGVLAYMLGVGQNYF
jgi:hypothetical protein